MEPSTGASNTPSAYGKIAEGSLISRAMTACFGYALGNVPHHRVDENGLGYFPASHPQWDPQIYFRDDFDAKLLLQPFIARLDKVRTVSSRNPKSKYVTFGIPKESKFFFSFFRTPKDVADDRCLGRTTFVIPMKTASAIKYAVYPSRYATPEMLAACSAFGIPVNPPNRPSNKTYTPRVFERPLTRSQSLGRTRCGRVYKRG